MPRSLSGGLAGPPVLLGLRIDGLSFIERDRENLIFALQRARIRALLQVRTVPPVLCSDLHAVDIGAHHPRQTHQLERLLQGDRVDTHRSEQRSGAGLDALRWVLVEDL